MEPGKIKFEWNIINPINLNHSFFTEIEKEELEHWFNKELRENMGGNEAIHKPNDEEIFGNGNSLRSF